VKNGYSGKRDQWRHSHEGQYHEPAWMPRLARARINLVIDIIGLSAAGSQGWQEIRRPGRDEL